MQTSRKQADVVFVDNFFYDSRLGTNSVTIVPHLGLLSLAATLEFHSIVAHIFDPKIYFAEQYCSVPDQQFYSACAASILDQSPKIVGFTAYGRSLRSALAIAKFIRKNRPEVSIILGGPHATIVGEDIMRKTDVFDLIVRYEAETIIVELVSAILSNRAIIDLPGLVVRRRDKIVCSPDRPPLVDVNSLLPPNFFLYPIDQLGLEELPVEAGRGCPFDCSFCSTASFFLRKYRVKTVERLVYEIDILKSIYNRTRFVLNHDLFGLDRRYVSAFASAVNGKGVTWSCSMRPDTAAVELFSQISSAGCDSIYFGVESGSDFMQMEIKKRLHVERMNLVVAAAIANNIRVTVSFITGFPQETPDHQNATLDLIGQSVWQSPEMVTAQLHMLSPEPGTALLHEHRTKMLFDGIGPEDESLSASEIAENPELYSVYYHFPTKAGRQRSLAAIRFINHWIPRVGWREVREVSELHFGGKLSSLFDHLFNTQALDGIGCSAEGASLVQS